MTTLFDLCQAMKNCIIVYEFDWRDFISYLKFYVYEALFFFPFKMLWVLLNSGKLEEAVEKIPENFSYSAYLD